jgi:hypothetical protein
MLMKDRTIARQELYEQVWTTPMSRLCAEYGLSDNGLRKICKTLSVPVPTVGYWAKRAHGMAPPTPPLPPNPKLTEYVVTPEQQRRSVELSDAIGGVLKENLAYEDSPDNRIAVDVPVRWHPALVVYRKFVREQIREWDSRRSEHEALQRQRKSPHHSPKLDFTWWASFRESGRLVVATHKPNVFRVAYGEHDRALLVLNAICRAATSRGFHVDELAAWAERLVIRKAEVGVPIRISSQLQHRSEPDMRLGDALSSYRRRISEPTGRLRLHVGMNVWDEKVFSESDDVPLEKRLNDVFKYIHRLVAKQAEKRRQDNIKAERREVERIAWEAEKARLEEQRRLEAEAQAERDRIEEERLSREAALIAEAGRWRQAMDLRMYVAHVKNAQLERPAELASWISWAEDVAARLDPTVERLTFARRPDECVGQDDESSPTLGSLSDLA